ncbi:collagen alpha-1(I) chain-like [Ornithorhynchus anatinus]|uniref:collagen alpha-1(I) chain-like n=1 Tax=Ornithorhynchus anatinus TaxID=9258 RepID=UPI0010A79761|nr:collagen alpha-1(I) chain-like [Ornithorhynchus anatinus]XP_039767976.1 collagen alpha-1(I) chain-like [Ornithorhynchus anatinus]
MAGRPPSARGSPSIDDLEESLQNLKVQADGSGSGWSFDVDTGGPPDLGPAAPWSPSAPKKSGEWDTPGPGRGPSQPPGQVQWCRGPRLLDTPAGNCSTPRGPGPSSPSPAWQAAGLASREAAGDGPQSPRAPPVDAARASPLPDRPAGLHAPGMRSLLPVRVALRSRSPKGAGASPARGRSLSLSRPGANRSRSFSPASKRTRWFRSRSQSPRPLWRCQPPAQPGRPRSSRKKTALTRPSRSRAYKPGPLGTGTGSPPVTGAHGVPAFSWSPHSLPTFTTAIPVAQDFGERLSPAPAGGVFGCSLAEMSPSHRKLTWLHLKSRCGDQGLGGQPNRQLELEPTPQGPKPR